MPDNLTEFKLKSGQTNQPDPCSRFKFNQDIDITEAVLESLGDDQARCDLVIGHYLAVHISLGRAAELLNLPFDDLRGRLVRSGVPLQVGPDDFGDLKEEINNFE